MAENPEARPEKVAALPISCLMHPSSFTKSLPHLGSRMALSISPCRHIEFTVDPGEQSITRSCLACQPARTKRARLVSIDLPPRAKSRSGALIPYSDDGRFN